MSFWRNLPHHRRTVIGGLLVGTIVTLVMLIVLQGLPIMGKVELAAYDYQFLRRGDRPAPNNIILVGLDPNSIQDLSQNRYPIPRAQTARALNFLCAAGAKAIGLDFEYFNPSTYGPRDDAAIATAMRRCGNVVPVSALQVPTADVHLASAVTITPPIDQIARASAAVGVANVNLDTDGVVRSVPLMQQGPGILPGQYHLYPAFSLALASVALHKPVAEIARGLPNNMLINFLGPQNPGDASQQTFQTASLETVASGLDAKAIFRDKIVLIIPAAIIIQDIKTGPFGTIYGGYIQANALNTILNRDPIVPAGGNPNTIILLIMGLITTIVTARYPIWHSAATFVALAVGYVVVATVLFAAFRSWVNLVTPEVEIFLVFGAIMALRFATEERLKRKTSKIFGQYVKPEIVELLVNSSEDEKALAGARRPISVLFVDVRGFTAMSEKMEPEDVVKALDIYLEELTESVQHFDGTVDKYVGDELMAIWNAPRFQHNHPLLAVNSALDMVARTDKINDQLRAIGLPALHFGVGVNTGDAIVGEMGSSFRKQYDVIGDSVNTGARLCSAAGGGEIIIGETTWELIGDRLVVEETEPLRLKGKSKPFRTFKVLAISEEWVVKPIAVPAPA
jgi:adenylate cyclase